MLNFADLVTPNLFVVRTVPIGEVAKLLIMGNGRMPVRLLGKKLKVTAKFVANLKPKMGGGLIPIM